jgi:histidinol-phosphate aminotransferase
MNTMLDLLRPEVRQLRAYRSAEFAGGLVRLNANESPWRPPGDESRDGLNRYPEPRPEALTARLAEFYGVAPQELLVTRGSSEAIDLLIRAFCRAGQDSIVISPPTFGMYEVYAQVQGAAIQRVPLKPADGYALPVAAIAAAWAPGSKLAFVCSPNNPTGNRVPLATISALCAALRGRGLVVVDGAYSEFASEDPTAALLSGHDNVVVLRTLSKARGLAGVRCGVLLGPQPIVEMIGRILPPYCFPTGCRDMVLRCMSEEAGTEFARRRDLLLAERARLASELPRLTSIVRVWPSEANFLLVECRDAPALTAAARAGGVLVRDFSWDPLLPGAVRITVGTPTENDQLLKALRE